MLDYEGIAEGRLTNQFQEAPKLKAMVRALVSPLVDLENQVDELRTERWISTAVGIQLDGLGYLVREPRLGRTDEEYRDAILFRIFVNTSNATPRDLIRAIYSLTKPDEVQYIEQYPATAMLFTDGPVIPSNLQQIMQGLAPAAISQVPILVSYSFKSPFRFGRSSPPSELFVNNDSDYLTANGADLQVQVENVSTGSRLAGVAAADLMVNEQYLELSDGSTLAINTPNYATVVESGYNLVGVFQ